MVFTGHRRTVTDVTDRIRMNGPIGLFAPAKKFPVFIQSQTLKVVVGPLYCAA